MIFIFRTMTRKNSKLTLSMIALCLVAAGARPACA
jgi:hypothetical protein